MASIDKFENYKKRRNILEKTRTFLLASFVPGLGIIFVLVIFVSRSLIIYYIPYIFFTVFFAYHVIPYIDSFFQKKYFGRSFLDAVEFSLNHGNTLNLLDVLNVIGDNKLIWVITYIDINGSNETSKTIKDEHIKAISHEVLDTNMSWDEIKRFAENLHVETEYTIRAKTEEYNTVPPEKKEYLLSEISYEIYLSNINGQFSLSCFDSDLINKISTTLGTGEKS